jgi:hypothetical protein
VTTGRAETIMFAGHDPYLVALSVVIAILGGYTGFGLTARIRGTPDSSHRVLLAGAAFFLAIGIWTMHFRRHAGGAAAGGHRSIWCCRPSSRS